MRHAWKVGLLTASIALTGPIADAAANPDPDPSFGVGGTVLRAINTDECCSGVLRAALQSDGKLVVGAGGDRKLVMRFTATGALDPGFSGDGIADLTPEYPTGGYVADVINAPDGKLLVARTLFDPDSVTVTRLKSDGRPDQFFGVGGTASFPMITATPSVLALQPDGKILLNGWGSVSGTGPTTLKLFRLTADGQPDATFSPATMPATNRPGEIAVDAAGRILVSGSASDPDTGQELAFVARLTPSGKYDTTFNGDGIALTAVPGSDPDPTSLLVAPDGKILLGGSSGAGFALTRLNADGTPDQTFNGGQVVITETPGATRSGNAESLAVRPTGEIVAGGRIDLKGAVAQYTPSGAPDTTFGNAGVLTVSPAGADAVYTHKVLLAADGAITLISQMRSNWDAEDPDDQLLINRWLAPPAKLLPPPPPVGSLTPTPPPPVSDATVRSALTVALATGKTAKLSVLRKRGVTFTTAAPDAGKLTVRWYANVKARGAKKAKRTLIASGTATYRSAGKATVKLKLTSAGKRALKHLKRVAVTATATFERPGKKPLTSTTSFTLRG